MQGQGVPFDDRYMIIAFIFMSFINAAIIRLRARPHIEKNPALAPGYQRVMLSMVLWLNIPWIIMGAGFVFGGIPSMKSYVPPLQASNFITAFYLSVIAELLLGFYWIFFRRGAEFLCDHPGILRGNYHKPFMIRVIYGIITPIGIYKLIEMLTTQTQ